MKKLTGIDISYLPKLLQRRDNMLNKKYIYDRDINAFVLELNKLISIKNRPIVVMCIGTTGAIGDCLGPLTGSILEKLSLPYIYGTLKNPIHALNLEERLKAINLLHNNPFILAVDACLGRENNIGAINIWKGSLSPGSALNKRLINVGDVSVTGIVNSFYGDGYKRLESTKISLVMDMAYIIGKGIYKVLNNY